MSVVYELFGIPYLDAENFRFNANVFGVGMPLDCAYPATTEGNQKLALVLQAASRMIDAHTCRDFSPENRSEQHEFNFVSGRISVNNPPVAEIVNFRIIYSPGNYQQFTADDFYINNQLSFIELTALTAGFGIVTEILKLGLTNPVAEITYKSYQDVPKPVSLACGYQAAKMINEGFVDATLPPNFGQLDMDGITVNNKKGYRLKAEDIQAAQMDSSAEQLLSAYKSITVR